MNHRTKLLVLVMLSALVAAAGAGVYLLRKPPEFYVAAMEQPASERRENSSNFLRTTSQLVSDVENLAHWEAVFSLDEVNAWLAEKFQRDHGQLLPPSVRNPQVDFRDGRVAVAFTSGSGPLETVISLDLDCWVAEPNVVAIQLRGSRAGTLPISAQRLLRSVLARYARSGGDVRWKKLDGAPVALVDIPLDETDRRAVLREIQIRDHMLYVAGTSDQPYAADLAEQGRPPQSLDAEPAKDPLLSRPLDLELDLPL